MYGLRSLDVYERKMFDMPIYEYKCVKCQISMEMERSIHEEADPICCGESMRRVYGTFGITFKGNGWGHQ
jgi:putative FmdB family regulatory protein